MTGNVKLDEPIGLAMRGIIFSETGRKAMLAAVANGRPALEAVDPMLAVALGSNYSKENEATIQAGYLVTMRMRELGFEKSRQVPLG
ncbi:MAG TPA: hypothetical protein VHZ56_14050, partial [Devosia sp.]|nr:hypothetical protein [Devosia sp.]